MAAAGARVLSTEGGEACNGSGCVETLESVSGGSCAAIEGAGGTMTGVSLFEGGGMDRAAGADELTATRGGDVGILK